MKSTHRKVIVILVFSLLISGCSYKLSIRPEEAKTKHTILVVPFKTAPFAICPFGIGGLFAIMGAAIEQGVTLERRERVARRVQMRFMKDGNPVRSLLRSVQVCSKGTPFSKSEICLRSVLGSYQSMRIYGGRSQGFLLPVNIIRRPGAARVYDGLRNVKRP